MPAKEMWNEHIILNCGGKCRKNYLKKFKEDVSEKLYWEEIE